MQIADLFISLGIKGQEKAVGALTTVEGSLKNVASMSLEAKAAILGSMYALEQMFAKSGAAGTDLSNFSAAIGVNAKTLQQYQYAARQIGVTNEETEGTFKSLQGAMSKTYLGQGAPAGYGQIAMLTGGMTQRDVENFMKNPDLLLQKLQVYAQKEQRIGVRNEALKSFGLSDNMIAALSKNAFQPQVLNKAPTYSDKEIKSLASADAAWRNLGNTIAMAVGRLNAAHGGQIVKDFSILVEMGLKVADILLRIVDRFHLFEAFGKQFDSLTSGMNKRIDGVVDSTKGIVDSILQVSNAVATFLGQNKVLESFAAYFDKIQAGSMKIVPFFVKIGEEIKKIGEHSGILRQLGPIFSSVGEIVSKFYTILGKVGEQIIKVADKFKVFESIGDVISVFLEGFEHALSGISSVLDKLTTLFEGPQQAEKLKKEATDFIKNLPGVFTGMVGDLFGPADKNKIPESAVESTAVPATEEVLQATPQAAATPYLPTSPRESDEDEEESTSPLKPAPTPQYLPVTKVQAAIAQQPTPAISAHAPISPVRGHPVDIQKILTSLGSGSVIFNPTGFVYAPGLKLVTPTSPLAGAFPNVTPNVSTAYSNQRTQNFNVNQNLAFHGGTNDHGQQSANHMKKSVQDAFRQLSSQVQGS